MTNTTTRKYYGPERGVILVETAERSVYEVRGGKRLGTLACFPFTAETRSDAREAAQRFALRCGALS